MRDILHVTSRRVAASVANRTVTFVLTNALQDRAGDTVSETGWKLDNYLANPVVLWGHDHSIPAIGRMARLSVEAQGLVGDVAFATAEQHPFADTIFQLVKGDFINAGSVGFIPLKYAFREQDRGIDWLEQELIEYSVCNIPMNPSCLARAVAGGIDITPLARAAGAENAGSYAELRAKILASQSTATPNLATLQRRVRANDAAMRLI